MIADIISRFSRTGTWRVAGNAELPQLDHDGDFAANQLLVVAGGLALTLSRCTPTEQRQCYPNAAFLYELLRSELRQHGKSTASAELLLDAFHETSEQLDRCTRQAFHRCLETRARDERMNAGEPKRAAPQSQSAFPSHVTEGGEFFPMSEAMA